MKCMTVEAIVCMFVHIPAILTLSAAEGPVTKS